MDSIDYTQYLILSLLVVAGCVSQSAMLSITVTWYFKKLLGSNYRLFFNLIAILTLIPFKWFKAKTINFQGSPNHANSGDSQTPGWPALLGLKWFYSLNPPLTCPTPPQYLTVLTSQGSLTQVIASNIMGDLDPENSLPSVKDLSMSIMISWSLRPEKIVLKTLNPG